MSKVNLPRKVAEAIEVIRKRDSFNNYGMITNFYKFNQSGGTNEKTISEYFAGLNRDIYVQAIVNNYEIEPEDITVTITPQMQEDIFHVYKNSAYYAYSRYKMGIVDTLQILNVEIDGVTNGKRPASYEEIADPRD